MPNIPIIQNSQSGFNNKSDMTPLNSLGLNLNNKSNNNNDAFKNIIANFNMITNNNSSRSIGLGLPSSSSLQNDMNNQIFLQNLFNQNYMNMNATNTSNNFNFPLNQLIGINNSNTNQINGKFSSGSTSNFENELLKKRMRENLLVNNMSSLNNVNNKPGDGSGWSNRNQVNDLGGNTQNVNIANAQNILYNYIQANNVPYNTSSGFVNEKKQN